MQTYDVILFAAFAIWAALTVVYQSGSAWSRWLSYRDPCSLLPLWTFFAPNPGQNDYHLVYRDELDGSTLSPWVELELTEERRWYAWLWNPEKRSKKVLSDVVQMLVELSADLEEAPNAIFISTPYLLVLNVVMALPKTDGAVRRQFVIAQTNGFQSTDDPQVLLKSSFHRFAMEPLPVESSTTRWSGDAERLSNPGGARS